MTESSQTELQLVEGLLNMLAGTSITELEVEYAGLRIRIQREATGGLLAQTVRAGEGEESSGVDDGSAVITSAYVGAFRHSAEDHMPGVGDEVTAGTKIAEIEVLGIRNSVVAPIDGVLAAFLVEDESPVEYGQPVAVIRPRAPTDLVHERP